MSTLQRFSMAIEKPLLERLEAVVKDGLLCRRTTGRTGIMKWTFT